MNHFKVRCDSLRTATRTTFRSFPALLAAISLSLVLTPIRPAYAQFGFLYSWNKPAGGSYAINSNWTPVGIPDAGNEGAEFDLNSTYSVQVANNYTVGDLDALSGNVTLAFQPQGFINPALTYTTGGLTVSAVDSSNASLTAVRWKHYRQRQHGHRLQFQRHFETLPEWRSADDQRRDRLVPRPVPSAVLRSTSLVRGRAQRAP